MIVGGAEAKRRCDLGRFDTPQIMCRHRGFAKRKATCKLKKELRNSGTQEMNSANESIFFS